MANKISQNCNKMQEVGASLVEYGLLVALIAVIAIPSVRTMGRSVKCKNWIATMAVGAVPHPSSPGYFVYRKPDGGSYNFLMNSLDFYYDYCMTEPNRADGMFR